jgi:hypothetical protein
MRRSKFLVRRDIHTAIRIVQGSPAPWQDTSRRIVRMRSNKCAGFWLSEACTLELRIMHYERTDHEFAREHAEAGGELRN